ncbi:MAG: APC family permease [Janthinobacterium lividum]
MSRTIGLWQAIALYLGAVVGAGVLVLPGAAASIAGPASMVSWCFDALLGIPLALTFGAMAGRYPDAGGVATFARRAFGADIAALVGWYYLVAAAVGEIIVPLAGSYYVADYVGLDRIGTYLLAAAILIVTVSANLRGLKVGGRLALGLSAAVALMLVVSALSAIPRAGGHWTPFAPHGWTAVGAGAVFVFYAFFGWEVIAHLAEEFHDPERDVPKATAWSVAGVTLLYLGTAAAVIGTGTYGSPELDRTAVARVLAGGIGVGAGQVAGGMALLIALGTSNAYIAGASRLAYALARDNAFPQIFLILDARGIPRSAILFVGGFAIVGLLLSYLTGLDIQRILIVPNVLGIATYVIGMAAGVRLLDGLQRVFAGIGTLLCAALLPFAGWALLWLLAIGSVAVTVARLRRCKAAHR